jgi:hypothetical protein
MKRFANPMFVLAAANFLAAAIFYFAILGNVAVSRTLLLSSYREVELTGGIQLDHSKLHAHLPAHFKSSDDWSELPTYLGLTLHGIENVAPTVACAFSLNATLLIAMGLYIRHQKGGR